MRKRLPRTFWNLAAMLVVGVLAVGSFGAANRSDDLLDVLGREARSVPVAGVRLSAASRFRPCAGELVPCNADAPLPSRRAGRLIQRADAAAREGVDASALH